MSETLSNSIFIRVFAHIFGSLVLECQCLIGWRTSLIGECDVEYGWLLPLRRLLKRKLHVLGEVRFIDAH